MLCRKSWLSLTLLLGIVGAFSPVYPQLIEERIIAQGQVGDINASFVVNSRVYVATHSKVMLGVYDFNTNPSLMGKINYPGNTRRYASALLVDGNYAYILYRMDVSGNQGRLAVVNISTPASPVLVAELSIPVAWKASMAKSGQFLYLFEEIGDFRVVNVSNPAAPTFVRSVNAEAVDGVVVANRLYTAEDRGLGVYDISQPGNPTLIDVIEVGSVERVAFANGRLFAVGIDAELLVFDTTNPNAPALRARYPTEFTQELEATNNYVFLSADRLGTEVVNVSNPATPSRVRVLPYYLVSGTDPVSGRALFQGGSILVLYNPQTDQLVRLEETSPLRAAQRNSTIFSLNEQSIEAYDITNPQAPVLQGKVGLPSQIDLSSDIALIGANHLAVSINNLLLIFEYTGSGFRETARITTGSPTPLHSEPEEYRLRVSSSTLAVYSNNGQINLYDVSNPAAPALRSAVPGSFGKFDMVGSFLYDIQSDIDDNDILRVYDVSTPSLPFRRGSVDLPRVIDLAAGAGYVLIATIDNELILVDARSPDAPQIVDESPLPGMVFPRVAFDAVGAAFYVYDGFYAYGSRKVLMFRLSDFPNLAPIATFTLNRPMWRLSFNASRVVGAGSAEGLILYRNTLADNSGLSISGITPSQGANRGAFTLRVFGTGFENGMSVRLERGSEQVFAQSVRFISSTELEATFEVSELPANAQWDVVVRSPTGREGRLVNAFTTVEAAPRIIGISPEATLPLSSVTLTITGANFAPGAQVLLLPPDGTSISPITATRVEYIAHNRLQATFDLSTYQNFWNRLLSLPIAARILVRNPDNQESNTFGLSIKTPAITSGRLSVPNTQSEVQIRMYVYDDATPLSASLRQGDRTIDPLEITRTQTSPGFVLLSLRYPIRLQDVGMWGLDLRFEGEQVVRLPDVMEVRKGNPTISNFEWTQPFTTFGVLRAKMRISPSIENLEDLEVNVRIPPRAAAKRTQLTATRIYRSDDGSHLIVEFAGVKTALLEDARPEIEVRHPLLQSIRVQASQPIYARTLEVNADVWVPNGYRAGRVIGIGTIHLHNRGQFPETPYLEFPIPVRESILQSGQFRAEYKVVRQDGLVVAEGNLPLTPNNYTIRAILKPVRPKQREFYVVRVRFIPTNRSASAELSTRIVPPVVSVVAFGLSAIIPYFAYNYSPHVACNTDYITEQVHERISSELLASPNPDDWDKVPELNDIREFVILSSDDETGEGFLSSLLGKIRTDFIESLPRQAAELWLTGLILEELKELELRGKLAVDIAQKAAKMRVTLASVLYEFAIGELGYDDLIVEMLQIYIPYRLPLLVAQSAIGLIFDKSRDCAEKIEELSRAYIKSIPITQRADVGFSYDPNEKNGAGGVDGYIRPDQSVLYEIKFENLPTATAGAEEVLIEDTLPEGLDLNSIEFVSVQVGTIERLLPEGTTTLNVDIDMRPERPVIVQVRSELDLNTRTLRVTYKGIDPETGDYYEEGFLPPNQNPPYGEGSVVFRIRPLDSTPSGTQFVNRATIVFDPHLGINAPIITNAHIFTLDKQPPSVTVETPGSSVPETKARLNWQATDDASGVADLEIWAQEGENARRIGRTRAEGGRSETGTVIIRARRFGDETRILARATDRVGNLAALSEEPIAVIRMGQAPPFSAGLHLLGIPLRPDAPDMQPLFGFQNSQWATYDPSTGQYIQHPNAAPTIGRGFWTVLPSAVQPNLVGDLPDPEQPFRIELQPGWNLIATPWTEPLVWHREAVQVRVQGIARPLGAATEFVEPYLWGWEPNPSNPQQGRYVLVSDAQILPGMQTMLQPWRGYWIYARQACTLELPTPETAALFAGLTRSYHPERNGGWSFRLAAHLGDSYDEVLLGVSGNEQGLQVSMPPAPPTRSPLAGVQLRLVREGVPMEADLLPRSRRAPTWTLELTAPPTDEERTRTLLITAPDIAQLPRGVNPVLRDLQTGERRFLRNGAGWQISVPREGLTRSYEISLVSISRMLRITGLQVQSSRGTGQHTLQFALSDEARVNITVLAGGQVVRTLEQGRSRSRGVQQAVWDGRDAQGRALPPGSYQILIQAETEDGQIVRATAPLVLTR